MTETYLGVDAGSISLDAAIVDDEGRLIASVVVLTHGRTVQALSRALEKLVIEE